MDNNLPIKKIVLAGFGRFFPEGMRYWTKAEFHGLINPRGYSYDISDPEIQQMLAQLVSERRICLTGSETPFLEVLRIDDI